MIKREEGFSLVELMITMVVFLFVIAASSQVLTALLTQFKQQSKIAETSIEGIVGLEILRNDIEHAGYGLPYALVYDTVPVTYNEAINEGVTPWDDTLMNDSTNNPPAGLRSLNNSADTLNNSDVLVVKAVNVGRSEASQKSTTIQDAPFSVVAPGNPRLWVPASDNLAANDRIIVISPGGGTTPFRTLVNDGGAPVKFYTTYTNVTSAPWPPTDEFETRFIYGVDPDTNLRMPFNRADYFIRIPGTVPSRCAPGTGVLYKGVISHVDGSIPVGNQLPLLDCVADFHVNFWLDTDGDGDVDWPPSDDISALDAEQIRDQVLEVRVYIVAHDGQMDIRHDFSQGGTKTNVSVTEALGASSRTLNFVDLSTTVGDPDYKYYRWKLYTIAAKPNFSR
jgi:prepilin-type N-terminal cleavage/methylation domain-containing protein